MRSENFHDQLVSVAQAYGLSPEALCENIREMLENKDSDNFSGAFSFLDTVPRNGTALTVEDYVEYLARTLPHPYGADENI